MSTYNILDEDGNVINTILASKSFMEENYEAHQYQFIIGSDEISDDRKELFAKQNARRMRDDSLKQTDQLVLITDHSNIEAIKEYRKRLRDWPDSEGFPDIETMPELENVIEELKNNV